MVTCYHTADDSDTRDSFGRHMYRLIQTITSSTYQLINREEFIDRNMLEEKTTENKTASIADMAVQCCKVELSLLSGGDLSLKHSFSVLSENMSIIHILLKTRFFGPHYCHKQYGYNHFDVAGPQSCQIWWENAKEQPLYHSRSPLPKPVSVCDFLRANNSNLPPIVHCFQDMADCLWNLRCQHGVPLFNAFVCHEPLNSGLWHLVSRN